MRWKRARRSDNVVDARGSSGGRRFGGAKGLSLGGVAAVVIIGLLMGQDPLQILGQLAGQATQTSSLDSRQSAPPAANDEQAEFVRAILGDTEDTWREIFQSADRQYRAKQKQQNF